MIEIKKSNRIQEKREHPRYDFIQASFYRLDIPESNPHPCQVNNLSFGGLLMQCDETVEIGQDLLIIINLDGLILKEKIRVMHSSAVEEHNMFGCRFLETKNIKLRNRELMRYINNILKRLAEENQIPALH